MLFVVVAPNKEFAVPDFTADDSYSIEVAKINVGDTIEWSLAYASSSAQE